MHSPKKASLSANPHLAWSALPMAMLSRPLADTVEARVVVPGATIIAELVAVVANADRRRAGAGHVHTSTLMHLRRRCLKS